MLKTAIRVLCSLIPLTLAAGAFSDPAEVLSDPRGIQSLSREIENGGGTEAAHKRRAMLLIEQGHVISAYDDLMLSDGADPEVGKMLFELLKECHLSESYLVQFRQICARHGAEEVLAFLNPALERETRNEKLWLDKAIFTFRINLYDQSLESIRRAKAINDDNPDYHRRLIVVLDRLQKKEEGREALSLGMRKFPEDPWFFESFLQSLISEGELAETKTLVTEYLQSDRFTDIAHYYLGFVFLRENDIERAVYHLKAALEENPQYLKAELLLAKVLYLGGRRDEAQPYLIHLVNIEVRDINYHSFLASHYVENDQFYQAEEILLKGLNLLSRYHYRHEKKNELLFKLAIIHERIRRTENAERIYLFLLNSIPDNHLVNGNLGRIFFSKGKLAEAEKYLRKSLEIRKEDRFRQILAEVYLKLGKYDQALALSREMLEDGTRTNWNLAFQTLLYNRRGEYLKALGTVNKVRKINPENLGYLDLEVLTLVNLKLFNDAKEVLGEAAGKTRLSYFQSLRWAALKARDEPEEAKKILDETGKRYSHDHVAFELRHALNGQTDRYWKFDPSSAGLKEIHGQIMNLDFAEAEKLIESSKPRFAEDFRLTMLKHLLDSFRYVFAADPELVEPIFNASQIPGTNLQNGYDHPDKVHASWMNSLLYGVASLEGSQKPEYLETALKDDPENPLALILLATYRREHEEYAKAEVLYRRILERRPDSEWAKINLAVCYDVLKRYREAEAIYLKLNETNPNNPVVLNNLAWLYLKADDPVVRNPELALSLASDATRLMPSSHHYDTLAEAFYQHRDFERAVKAIEKALLYDFQNLDHFKIQKRKFEEALKNPEKHRIR